MIETEYNKNDMNPKISVIVPVYNAEKYLNRCIDSILAQTFTDFELLLINDGSKDKSGEICDEYSKKDIRVKVFHKENGGASSARNVGLDNARGEYICFCDADDFVDKTWLLCFSLYLEKNDMVISGFKIFRNNKYVKDVSMPVLNNKLSIIQYLEDQNISGYLWCKCFKKEIIDKYHIKFNEKYIIWEDLDFIYRYWCHASSIKLDKEITYSYFMPNLGMKYASKISFECCESLLLSVCYLFLGKENSVYAKYLNAAKNCLKNDIRSLAFIKGIRDMVKYIIIK